MADRIDTLRAMLERNPGDARIRFGLAAELEKQGRWDDVVRELRAYLDTTDDQGNAWGRLARALCAIGKDDEAREAWRRGADAARRHGHPSMAAEFDEAMDELDPG